MMEKPKPEVSAGPHRSGTERKHVTIACDHCRRKKQRCDGKLTRCGQCRTSGQKCSYSHKDRRTERRDAQEVHALRSRVKYLETIIIECRGEIDPQVEAESQERTAEGFELPGRPESADASADVIRSGNRICQQQSETSLSGGQSHKLPQAAPSTSARSLVDAGRGGSGAVYIADASLVRRNPDKSYGSAERNHAGQHLSPDDPIWVALVARHATPQLRMMSMPALSCDLWHLKSCDMLSQTLLSFRDSALRAISNGSRVYDLIGTKTPELELFFRPRQIGDPHTAWTWACELAKAYPVPLKVQLTGVFVAGLQMRFFINPCEETNNDLPFMLRAVRRQYTEPHADGADGTAGAAGADGAAGDDGAAGADGDDGADICALTPLNQQLLSHLDCYEALMETGQNPNWPYSDLSCLARDPRTQRLTLSRAFVEHISDLRNHTAGARILSLAPAMAPYLRSEKPGDAPWEPVAYAASW